jgi:hypothetical protein
MSAGLIQPGGNGDAAKKLAAFTEAARQTRAAASIEPDGRPR